MSLLKIKNLSLSYDGKKILKGISFSIEPGEHLGIIGESGAGKSLLAKLILALLPDDPLFEYSGQIFYKTMPLPLMDGTAYEPLRMKEISIAFQDPVMHLDPIFTVKSHFMEVYRYNLRQYLVNDTWLKQSIKLLAELGLDNPEVVMGQHAYQLSGGQSQLVLLALSLSCHPSLIFADEITSSLDVGQQVKLLKFFRSYFRDTKSTMVLISHDLRLVSNLANYSMVMFRGVDVEYGKTEELMKNPLHPYTASLVKVAGYLSVETDRKFPSESSRNLVSLFPESKGCLYYHCCNKKDDRCINYPPLRIWSDSKRWVRCFLYDE